MYDLSFKSHIKNLGIYIDVTLSMTKYIEHISRSVYLEIRKISSIRHLLTTKATAQLMHSCVVSRLDYCYSLFIDINCDQMYRLQKVQNHAAKVVFRKSRHEHVRPLLKALHWMPVEERINFKIAALFSVSLIVLCHHTCLHVSQCAHLRGLSVPVQMGKTTLSCIRWKLKAGLY